MAEYEEEGMAVAAAKILLSLRSRKLQRWPEWVPRPSKEPAAAAVDLQRPSEETAEAEVELPLLPVGWPKRPRSPRRVLAKGTAWSLSLESLLARLGHRNLAGTGSSSSGEDKARSPPRIREKTRRQEIPPSYGAAAGSGPSTSGVDRARSHPRPRASEKGQAKVAARKEATMAASSPETPFDYATAAGSGASSSGEEEARSPAKRKVRGPSGSGGPSSGDEGCSSPAKRTRADVTAGDGSGEATAAVKVEGPKIEENYRDEKGHLLFDLNEDINMSW